MILKCSLIFIIVNIVSCIRSIQKIPPKYNTAASSSHLAKLTPPSDKNSFPDVVYPTSIFDMPNPFYFNDNNYEVLDPFSEDVKSSYKLLSSIVKSSTKTSPGNVNNHIAVNEVVTTPAADDVMNVSVKENITEQYYNNSKEYYVNSEVIRTPNNTYLVLGNTVHNYALHNVSLLQEVQNESCSKIPLLVKINMQIFKGCSDKSKEEKVGIASNLSSQDNEEITKYLKQDTDTSSNESSEEIISSSEEHYTELQDIKHSDFIQMLSVLLLDLLVSTENATSKILNTTVIENESLERIVLEYVNNLTNLESFGLMESNVTGLTVKGTRLDSENLINLTEPLNVINLRFNETRSDFENFINLTEPFNVTDLIVNETRNDFKNLINLTEPFNFIDPTVNGSYSNSENLINLTEPLNVTNLRVNETRSDFENFINLTEPFNVTDLIVNETRNDFKNLINLTEPFNFIDPTVNGSYSNFENLINLTEPLNLTDLTVNETRNDFDNLITFTEPLNITDLIINETRNDLENFINLTEPFNLIDMTVNGSHCGFDNLNLLNLTEPFRHSNTKPSKESKEDYFLELLISLESFCENNKTVDNIADCAYLTNQEYLLSENHTVI